MSVNTSVDNPGGEVESFCHSPRAVWGIALLTLLISGSSVADTAPALAPDAAAGSWRAKPFDAHQTLWERAQYITNSVGGQTNVFARTNHYVEIASGLNFFDAAAGVWQRSRPVFTITADGAAANFTAHKVALAADIASESAINLTTPDGKVLHSTPLGLSLSDEQTSVVLGQIKSSIGTLAASNIIVYPDCFSGAKADVRVILSRAGVEVDVVLKEQLAASPADLGLNPLTSKLEVLTEFFQTPAPAQIPERAMPATGTNGPLVGMPSDVSLHFGAMAMRHGCAFLTDKEISSQAPDDNPARVFKSWQKLENRDFLIEATRWQDLQNKLKELPPSSSARPQTNASSDQIRFARGARRLLPFVPAARPADGKVTIAQAKTSNRDSTGLVLDYSMVSSMPGYEFLADTYLVTDLVYLQGGPVTIHGGAVIKYSSGAALHMDGPVACLTSPGRMAIFTSKNDNSAGQIISDSNGNPAADRFASPAIAIDNGSTDLKYLKIGYAVNGINYNTVDYQRNYVSHSQIVHTTTPFHLSSSDLTVRNLLVQDAANVFEGSVFNVQAEHLTVHTASVSLGYNSSQSGSLNLVNSLVVGVPDCCMSYTLDHTDWMPIDDGSVFQTAGSGAHYLSDYRFRDSGTTTGINGKLLSELRGKTTYPPIRFSGPVSGTNVLAPQAPRDDDGFPDRGFHYECLDWLVSGLDVPGSATLLVTNGAALGIDFTVGASGIVLEPGAKLISEGSALQRNAILWFHAVQEGASAIPLDAATLDASTGGSEAQMRFTDLPLEGGGYDHLFHNIGANTVVALNNCTISGGLISPTTPDLNLACTNSVLEDNSLNLTSGSLIFRNNLFVRGTATFANPSGYASLLSFRDDLFDHVNLSASGLVDDSNNGYISTSGLPGSLGGDVPLASLAYQSGPLGPYYLPPTLPDSSPDPLINGGSRLASDAGLFHQATTVDQAKEGSSQVDISAHFVALYPPSILETIWVEDGLPPGATPLADDSDAWNWTGGNVYSGALAHQSLSNWGEHQHYFTGATTSLAVQEWDKLFCYIYLDALDMPDEIMLQWFSGDESWWHHRAYWGTDEILWTPRSYMGPLPAAGGWVRLEVPASAVDLEGRNISGMAFTLSFGSATWDRAGLSHNTAPKAAQDFDGDLIADYLENRSGSGVWDPATETNFNNPDTDGDGILDGLEAAQWRSPLLKEANVLWFTPVK